MGKGTRKRIEFQAKLEKQAQQAEQEKQKKRRLVRGILIAAAAIIVVVLAVLWLWFRAEHRRQTGADMREQIVMSTDHFKVDGAMMSYFIHAELIDYASTNSSTLTAVGLNAETDLHSQEYLPDDNAAETWFDYFSELAQEKVTRYLRLAEGARKEGLSLDAADTKHIESQLQTVRDEAAANEQDVANFIADNFGRGVNEEDIRRALELQMLVSKYEDQLVTDKTYTDAELTEYYEANTAKLNTCDYYTITFSSAVEDDFTDEQVRAYNASSKQWADELAECHDLASFKQYLYDYYVQYYEDREQEYDDKEIQDSINNTAKLIEGATYTDDELGRWAMDSSRQVGDTKVIEGANEYAVYLITKAPTRLDYQTRTFRQILLTDDTYKTETATRSKANELRDTFLAGEQTEAAFAALAKEYSEDIAAKDEGGLCSDYRKEDGDANVSEWAYDAGRQTGDTRIIKGEDENYYLVYFVGEGQPCWKISAAQRMKSDGYDAAYGALSLIISVQIDTDAIGKLPG